MKKIEKQIEEYLDWCENERKLGQTTITTRRTFFKRFIEEIPVKNVEQLSNQIISDWIKRHSDLTGSSINEYVTKIKTMLRYFQRSGVKLKHINLEQITRTKEENRRKVFYTKEQIDDVLSGCDELEWLLISLCFDCGFRIHELTALRLDNLEGCKVIFIGKGRKLRETYMSERTRSRLDDWIEEQSITDNLWIQKYNNGSQKPMTKKTLGHIMQKAFMRAGYDNFHPHALRHSFATDIRRNGAPIDVVRDMLGHSNIQTTIRYVHSLDGQLEESFNKYRFATVN